MAEKIKVNIAGMDYTLTSELDKTQIQQIAVYVDKKIKEVDNDKLTRENQLLLAALNITDEMYNLLIKHKKLKDEAKEPIEKYPRLRDDYQSLIMDYEKVKADFEKSKDDFMESMKKIDDLNSVINKIKQEIENKDKIIKSKDNNLKKLRENLQKLQDDNLDLNKKVKELEKDL
ncbi:cell division protein ZapA [Anaerococcus faecalis]|nr:cell division protein ZapA [Anaerococcus faecalis]